MNMRDVAFEIPCSSQWELAESRSAVAHLPEHWNAMPLTRVEIEEFSLEDRERREAWRAACKGHWDDLVRVYPAGMP
jgi:hypothetical protein